MGSGGDQGEAAAALGKGELDLKTRGRIALTVVTHRAR